MSILTILQDDAPVLRQVAGDTDPMDPRIAELARDMIETLHAARGVGLAAPQVGQSVRVIVLNFGKGGADVVMVNPVIVRKGTDIQILSEGCLSIGGGRRYIKKKRARKVWVEFNTPGFMGRETMKLKGLMAAAAQHECDHLEGRLMTDA